MTQCLTFFLYVPSVSSTMFYKVPYKYVVGPGSLQHWVDVGVLNPLNMEVYFGGIEPSGYTDWIQLGVLSPKAWYFSCWNLYPGDGERAQRCKIQLPFVAWESYSTAWTPPYQAQPIRSLPFHCKVSVQHLGSASLGVTSGNQSTVRESPYNLCILLFLFLFCLFIHVFWGFSRLR